MVRGVHMEKASTPEIKAPTRDIGLIPPPNTSRPRKWRFGVVVVGIPITLGAGVAAGANVHRIVDLEQTATWLHEQTATWLHRSRDTLQSGFETARDEI